VSRYARKVDRNHAEIRDGLRACGFRVADTSRLGSGFPDLVVSAYAVLWMVEIKMPGEPLTEDEQVFADLWAEHYLVAHSLEEALSLLGN
jgi:hypothetical protein